MSVPSAMLRVIVSMMEASEGAFTAVTYCKDSEIYSGVSACNAVTKLEGLGIIDVVGVVPALGGDDLQVTICNRDDFMSGFAAGALANRNGQDLYYADYCSHPFAFTCGWQYAELRRNGKSGLATVPCHGMLLPGTDDVHVQGL
ncbi:MAG: hypothetical protein ACRC8Q_06030 [Aeromonas sp.]